MRFVERHVCVDDATMHYTRGSRRGHKSNRRDGDHEKTGGPARTTIIIGNIGGSSKNGRDSNPQYRGIKAYGGEMVTAGSIIVRQVGSTFHAGKNVGTGKDYTLFALTDGKVEFNSKSKRKSVSVVSV